MSPADSSCRYRMERQAGSVVRWVALLPLCCVVLAMPHVLLRQLVDDSLVACRHQRRSSSPAW